jgi:proteasome assembly chaperone (PAC2) family protein
MANPFVSGVAGGASQTHKGSFRAEDLKMTFAGSGGDGALVQQANFTVNRAVNFLYEIGSNNVYFVGNRRQGQAALQRVVSTSEVFKNLLSTYGDMCNPKDIVFTTNSGCGSVGGAAGAQTSYTLKFATLTSIGASVTAQDVTVNESLQFMCVDIDI